MQTIFQGHRNLGYIYPTLTTQWEDDTQQLTEIPQIPLIFHNQRFKRKTISHITNQAHTVSMIKILGLELLDFDHAGELI